MANTHTKEQREFIVRKLAAFEPPRAIVIDFAAVFPGVRADENDVKRLDRDAGAVLSPELHILFLSTREAAMLDPAAAPYANQQARLIALSNDVKFYRGNNQLAESRAVLRQIAEEQGAVGGKGGKVVPAAASGDEIVAITRTIVDPAAPKDAT